MSELADLLRRMSPWLLVVVLLVACCGAGYVTGRLWRIYLTHRCRGWRKVRRKEHE